MSAPHHPLEHADDAGLGRDQLLAQGHELLGQRPEVEVARDRGGPALAVDEPPTRRLPVVLGCHHPVLPVLACAFHFAVGWQV